MTIPSVRRVPGCWFWVVMSIASTLAAGDWPRFRGPNGSGISDEKMELPDRFEAGSAAWSTALPPGISSPVIAGSRMYVTGLRGKDLLTIALHPASGKVLWERRAPAEREEEVHSTSSRAASTPATDGERAVVFFGAFGLLAYDPEGEELWRAPLGPFNNPFGAASSPIIARDLVVLNCDQDRGSFLLALDKTNGKPRFRIERPDFPRGFATPIIWELDGSACIVVAGTLQVKGYALADGKEIWSGDGLARIVNPTPVLGGGQLYVASFSPGGDAGERIVMPPFDEYAAANDRDKDGRISDPEVPPGDMKPRFLQLDADKDGFVTRAEWQNMARIFDSAKNALLAFRPAGGAGGAPISKAWEHARGVPYVPSPLYHDGHVYMVKDGGIFTSINATSGESVKQGRLPAGGTYYASPVLGGGKIFAVSLAGEVVALSASPRWEVLAVSPLGEQSAATPAIAGGRIYIRTQSRLHAFGPPPEKAPGAGG